MKKLTYEEKFERFKAKIKAEAIGNFFILYKEMKDIEEGLVEEKRGLMNNGNS